MHLVVCVDRPSSQVFTGIDNTASIGPNAAAAMSLAAKQQQCIVIGASVLSNYLISSLEALGYDCGLKEHSTSMQVLTPFP
jgi:hypothetical protein